MKSQNIVKIAIKSKSYPALLAEIADPPKILYCRGNIELLNTDCMAVIGTRKMTTYGKESAIRLTGELAKKGLTIVSGLALGIDAMSHRATLDIGGSAIAVLGSGVDNNSIYPRTNYKLAQDILNKNGLIISEYEPGMHATEFTFPARNRIISGLSLGVLVIEADDRSGSLITARLAAEQNRDVFAIPGSIFSSRSSGVHKLIKKGAKLTETVEDILEEYPLKFNIPKSNINLSVSTKDPVKKAILDILDKDTEVTIDKIMELTGIESSRVLTALTYLEIDGIIKSIGSGKIMRVI